MLAEERSVVSGCRYLAVDLEQATGEMAARIANLFQPRCLAAKHDGHRFLPKVRPVFAGAHAQTAATGRPCCRWHHSKRVARQCPQQSPVNPMASTALVQLLRSNHKMSVEDGLMLESLTYSTLQHGAEFLAWLNKRKTPNRDSRAPEQPVTVDRNDDRLTITLNRANKHNAFSASMRDALCEALALAETDHSIGQVILQGAGPSFCAGGDLDEFGLARDAALAHLTRTTRSPARLIDRISQRTTARLHGACIGAGIEMTAFAGHGRPRRMPTLRFPK